MNQKSALLTVLATFLTVSAIAAPKAKKTVESWILFEKQGKAAGNIHEQILNDSKDHSSTLKQDWINLGKSPSTISIEAISGDDDKLPPSWLQVHFKTDDGKEEYNYRAALRMNGRFKDFEVTFERLKPKYEKNVKEIPRPVDAIFYSSLPRYVAKLKSGFYTVTSIMEDGQEARLDTRPVRIEKMDETKKIAGLDCTKALVDAGGSGGYMWVSAEGKLCEYTLNSPPLKWTLVSEAEAKKFASSPKTNPASH